MHRTAYYWVCRKTDLSDNARRIWFRTDRKLLNSWNITKIELIRERSFSRSRGGLFKGSIPWRHLWTGFCALVKGIHHRCKNDLTAQLICYTGRQHPKQQQQRTKWRLLILSAQSISICTAISLPHKTKSAIVTVRKHLHNESYGGINHCGGLLFMKTVHCSLLNRPWS